MKQYSTRKGFFQCPNALFLSKKTKKQKNTNNSLLNLYMQGKIALLKRSEGGMKTYFNGSPLGIKEQLK